MYYVIIYYTVHVSTSLSSMFSNGPNLNISFNFIIILMLTLILINIKLNVSMEIGRETSKLLDTFKFL